MFSSPALHGCQLTSETGQRLPERLLPEDDPEDPLEDDPPLDEDPPEVVLPIPLLRGADAAGVLVPVARAGVLVCGVVR